MSYSISRWSTLWLALCLFSLGAACESVSDGDQAGSSSDDDSAAGDDTADDTGDDDSGDDTQSDDTLADDTADDDTLNIFDPPDPSDAVGVFAAKTGDDLNPGTMAQPVLTIARGIALAYPDQKNVFVARGVYAESLIAKTPL